MLPDYMAHDPKNFFLKIYLAILEKKSLRNFFLLSNTLKTEQKLLLEQKKFVPQKKSC